MNRFILAICCVIAVSAPVFGEVSKESLASLIQAGNHKEALARIRAGADVNEAQPDGTRPIHWAVYRVDYELLGALLAKKAKVNVANEFGPTPIAEAAKLGDARMVKMLLDAGAEPEGANTDGQTALMLAINTGELPVVQMLIKAGANVNRIEEFRNQTPLMWAATAPRNAGEMVKLLLSKGADVNVPTPEGVTPLMLALDNQHDDVAKLLLDRGANPNVWDWWGRTALFIAIDRREAVLAPLRTGLITIRVPTAPAEPRASSGPPVSSIEIINALLAAGVDVNPQLNMHRPS